MTEREALAALQVENARLGALPELHGAPIASRCAAIRAEDVGQETAGLSRDGISNSGRRSRTQAAKSSSIRSGQVRNVLRSTPTNAKPLPYGLWFAATALSQPMDLR